MCGIFGFQGFQEPGLLRRMADIIRHRGPDGEGFFEQGNYSMGMRRLSIIDLVDGDQPIFNEDRNLVVCSNGEIYNYVELTKELQAKGHVFRTNSDTETLLHAYEQWGMDFLRRLNGMFAVILYDRRNDELIIARDRAGQKPLYYYHRNGRFLFASEAKAILESQHVERACNIHAINSYLGLRYTPQPDTMFKDIKVLPAGHFLRLRQGEIEIHRYWDVAPPINPHMSSSECLDAFEETFSDAVRLTLRSDVPVGAYLSAGIDSSLVVSQMTNYTSNIKTFSLGFDSPIDELPQARTLAAKFGCDHHEVVCVPEDLGLLPKVIWHLERPIGDVLVLAYYKLAEAASRHVKVVLSGEGADELFAGYSFHKIIRWTDAWERMVPGILRRGLALPMLAAMPVPVLNKLFNYPAYLGNKGKARVVEYFRHYGNRTLAENYVYLRTLWERDERRQVFSDQHRHLATGALVKESETQDGALLDRLLRLHFDDWLQDNLLLRQDKNTMAHSLELRAPFLDHNLIELAFRMPPTMKVNWLTDKFVERQYAKKILPAESANRPKQPFYFPLEYFYDNPRAKELVAMTLNEDSINERGYFNYEYVRFLKDKMDAREFVYLKQLYALVMLELWHMVFIDRQQLW